MPIYERMTVKGRAGALQTYQGGQQAVAPGGTSARVSGEAGAIYARGAAQEGQALGNLAGAIGKAGHTFNAAYEDYSKTKATELFNRYRMGMNQEMDGEGGIMSSVGEDAFDANGRTMGASSRIRGELLKDYGQDSRVAQIFNQLADPHENACSVRAQQHGEKEYRLWQDRTDDAAAKGYFDEALAGISDPQAFAQGAAGALWHVEQQLRRKGYSGEALERGLLEASSRIYKSGIAQAISDKDFSSADRLLGEGSAHMTEADRLDMQGKIQAGRERETLEQMQLLADAGDVEGLKRLKEQVEQGTAFGAATQGLNAGIAAQAAQWGGGKVKYYRDDTGRTPRDPRRGQIDCSGWVGWTLEQNGIRGFRSLNAEGQIDEAWKRGARQLSQQEVLASPRENMLVCIDTGQKGFDRGRAKGIDHVVLTYRDPQTGRLMVTESSGSKGVRSIPWEKWAAQYPRATFYGADLSTMKGAGAASPAGGRRPYGDLKLNEANNNPGNISGSGGVGRGYKAYGTTLEGFKALDELIRTKYAGMTPAQLAEKYAPAGDPRGKNDPVAYAIQIANDLGMIPEDARVLAKKAMDGDREARAEMMQYIDGDAKIDVSDKHVRSKLMRSIAKREGPTDRFNLDEIDYVTGVKEMPAGYQSKDLRKESREQPVQGSARPGFDAKMAWYEKRAQSVRESALNKERREILSGAKDAEYLALNKGDPTRLLEIEGKLRSAGLTEDADSIRMLREGIAGGAELYRQASTLPLPEAQKVLQSAQEGASTWIKEDGAALTPDEHRLKSSSIEAASRVLKARADAYAKDPALAAMQDAAFAPVQDEKGNVTAEAMVAASLEVQMKNGVRDPQALPKEQAARLGEAWQNSPVPRAFIDQLKSEYGSQYPAVLRQLVQGKHLPPDVALMDGMEPGAASLLAKTTQKDWVKQVEASVEKDDKNALKEYVRAGLEPFTATFFAQGDKTSPAVLADAAYRLALQYRTQGMDNDDAAETAVAKLYGDSHKVVGRFRVPVQYNASLVEAGSKTAREQISTRAKEMQLAVPENSGIAASAWERLLGKTLLDKAEWVNTADGRGVMLVLGIKPVRRSDGEPVTMTFEELEKLGGQPKGNDESGIVSYEEAQKMLGGKK